MTHFYKITVQNLQEGDGLSPSSGSDQIVGRFLESSTNCFDTCDVCNDDKICEKCQFGYFSSERDVSQECDYMLIEMVSYAFGAAGIVIGLVAGVILSVRGRSMMGAVLLFTQLQYVGAFILSNIELPLNLEEILRFFSYISLSNFTELSII